MTEAIDTTPKPGTETAEDCDECGDWITVGTDRFVRISGAVLCIPCAVGSDEEVDDDEWEQGETSEDWGDPLPGMEDL